MPTAPRAPGLDDLAVWVVEDNASANEAMVDIARGLGARARGFGSAEAALAVDDDEPDIVITDMRLPGQDGMALVEQLRARQPPPAVVVVTAYGSVGDAVQAMRLGVVDFLTKPLDIHRVEAVLCGAASRVRLDRELRDARAEARRLRAGPGDDIVYRSAAMRTVVDEVRRAAESDATILLLGESGTGKERLARLVHEASPRAAGPFVAAHVAAVGEGVLESELFGHERGAFTGATARRAGLFEQAHKGTLFLDEIGEIDARTQVRLLRVLQERTLTRVGGAGDVKVDVRLVCATHRDLEAEVAAGRFRQDLFYRLDVVRVTVPPLRQRREDVPALVAHFIGRHARRYGRPAPELPAGVAAALAGYDWPGNVRELENVMERLVVMTRGGVDLADLPGRIAQSVRRLPGPLPEGAVDLPRYLDGVERELVERALARSGGNRSEAARRLGITREGLRYKIEKFGLGDG